MKITLIQTLFLLNCFLGFSQDGIQTERKFKIYFTPAAGLGVVSDTFVREQIHKNTISMVHTDFMSGNLANTPFHLVGGVNFSATGGKIKQTNVIGAEVAGKSKTIVFQTELGLRTYLNKNNLEKNPLFFKLSWVHGVNDNKYYHYSNEYNGLAVGLGITKPLLASGTALFAGFEYQVNRQEKVSIYKNGYMNLDLFQFNIGLTF